MEIAEKDLGDTPEPQVELSIWNFLDTARSREERVTEARRLLSENATYARGCSEFMSAVLGIPYELANALMGATPTSLGSAPPYSGLTAGDVVGWKSSTGMGHVALYVPDSDARTFIDVKQPGEKPRHKNGYYNREIFKSSRF